MEFTDIIFLILVIIFSAVIHEVMHGVAADKLGDPTARYAGRLTLNPIPHLDPFGSIILPIILAVSGASFFFAWAKPVPYNPFNLRSDGVFRRFSEAIVAAAGPLSNLVIALVTGLLLRFLPVSGEVASVLFIIVVVNVMLFLFNLMPIPPLDGSKIVSALLPRALSRGYGAWRDKMEANPFLGMGLVIVVILILGSTFASFVYSLARMIAGI
jgi:Zn-dependent protease